ncbi:CHC2 zinc finger domain-containing protein [Pseudochelatococcus sp. G4_1912]|uniref:DUF7146 domain-containing protein n=1 Tax=Pseudochelatococcus sp. G4_1912 TaxID=3114288 RepID=UPI0039C64B06
MARIPDAVLDDLRARNPVHEVAGRYVALRNKGNRWVGPCPICSSNTSSRTACRFEASADKWVCAVCCDGGDVIRLIECIEGRGFREAVEALVGDAEPDPAEASRRAAERAKRKEMDEREVAERREKERTRCRDIWRSGIACLPGSSAATYLQLRGLNVPDTRSLRFVLEVPYFHPGPDGKARLIYSGPAMLAAIQDAICIFRGLHITWIDLDQPDGKALIVDPETGEQLPAKKVRGVKQGNAIRLISGCESPSRLVLGEGVETVLSPWTAMHRAGHDLSQTAFWSSVDLGNLGGRALETVPHPVETGRNGAPRRMPGPVPDMSVAGMAIPDSVTDIVLLGDGDSDRFLTGTTLRRAAQRFAAPGRTIRLAWARDGYDFNDMLRNAVEAKHEQ